MKPGDLGWLRAAIFHTLDQGNRPFPLPADAPQRPWLNWLGVALVDGPTPTVEVQSVGLDLDCEALSAAGLLPEVVYSCLVQTWWHPGQQDWVARTRSEIVACYQPGDCQKPGWTLNLEALERVNAYRLQELTPEELLAACRPFCPEAPQDEALEGWVLLHLDRFQRLQDVADCLSPFHTSVSLGLPAEQVEQILQSESAPAHHISQHLRLPAEADWPLCREILGGNRLRSLLGSERI